MWLSANCAMTSDGTERKKFHQYWRGEYWLPISTGRLGQIPHNFHWKQSLADERYSDCSAAHSLYVSTGCDTMQNLTRELPWHALNMLEVSINISHVDTITSNMGPCEASKVKWLHVAVIARSASPKVINRGIDTGLIVSFCHKVSTGSTNQKDCLHHKLKTSKVLWE